MYSIYQENKDLVLMGGYTKGQNEEIDLAMECWPKICELLNKIIIQNLILKIAL